MVAEAWSARTLACLQDRDPADPRELFDQGPRTSSEGSELPGLHLEQLDQQESHGDLITLVYNVLGGELTVRFVLKVITVAAIASTVFGYYLWDLRREERE